MADPTKLLKSLLDSNLRIEKILLGESKKDKKSPISSAASGMSTKNMDNMTSSFQTLVDTLLSITDKTAKATVTFLDSVLNFTTRISTMNPQLVIQGGEALKSISANLLAFSLNLAKALPILVLSAPFIPIMTWAIRGLLTIFIRAGRPRTLRYIIKASISFHFVAKTIKKLAISIAFMGLVLGIILAVDARIIPAIPGIILAIGFAFRILGKTKRLIAKGARVMGFWVALSLITLGYGIKSFADSIISAMLATGNRNILTTFLTFSAIIGGLGLTFGIIGLGAAFIIPGALAVALIGVSLIALSFGLKKIIETVENTDPKLLKKLPDVIEAPMLSFVKMGVLSPFILAGSLAAIATGTALSVLAWGFNRINESGIQDFDEKKFYDVITSLGDAFRDLGAGEKNASWSQIAKGLFTKTPVARGISYGLGIGKALTSIAAGVGTWADLQNIPLIIGYDKVGNPVYGKEKVNVNLALKQISWFLPELLGTFAKFADKSGGKSDFSVTKFLLGNDLSKTPAQRGIRNAMKMGKALTSIAEGVGAWADLQNIKTITGYTKIGRPIYGESVDLNVSVDNIAKFLPEIQKVFEEFEDSKDGGFSISKFLLGNDLGKTPMQRGIANALNIGKVLTSTAEGIGSWANIQNIPLITSWTKAGIAVYDSDKRVNISKAIDNVRDTLMKISYAMIDVGGEDGDDTKPLRKAVKAIKPLGDILSGVAEAMDTFANLENIRIIDKYVWNEKTQKNEIVYKDKGVSVSTVAGNIALALHMISSAFKSQETKESRHVKRGLKALGPLGDIMEGFAEGIETFANIENIKIIDKYVWNEKLGKNVPKYSEKSVSVPQIGANIKTAVTTIMNAFSSLESADRKKLEKALSGVGEIDDVLQGFANSIKTFSALERLQSPIGYKMVEGKRIPIMGKPVNALSSVDNIKTSIVDILKMINEVGGLATRVGKSGRKLVGVFAFEHLTEQFLKLADAANNMKIFAVAFKSIAKDMGVFASNFNKMSGDDIVLYHSWTKSLMKFAELDVKSYRTNVEKIKDKFDFGLDELKDKAKNTFGTDDPDIIEGKVETKKDKEDKTFSTLLREIRALRTDIKGVQSTLESELEVRVSNVVKIED